MTDKKIKISDVLKHCNIDHGFGDLRNLIEFVSVISAQVSMMDSIGSEQLSTLHLEDTLGEWYLVILGSFEDTSRFVYVKRSKDLPSPYFQQLQDLLASQNDFETIPITHLIVPLLKEELPDIAFGQNHLRPCGTVERYELHTH